MFLFYVQLLKIFTEAKTQRKLCLKRNLNEGLLEQLEYMPGSPGSYVLVAKKKKIVKPKFITIDFSNEDGSVDEWIYDTSYNPMRPIQVTLNIWRRNKK